MRPLATPRNGGHAHDKYQIGYSVFTRWPCESRGYVALAKRPAVAPSIARRYEPGGRNAHPIIKTRNRVQQ